MIIGKLLHNVKIGVITQSIKAGVINVTYLIGVIDFINSYWILRNNYWEDSGIWMDDQLWND